MKRLSYLLLVVPIFFGAFLCVTAAYAATPTLLGYWNFDASSGSTAADHSGNNHTAQLFNSPTWTAGKINNALTFNASSTQYATTTLAWPTTGAISMWVDPTAYSDYMTVGGWQLLTGNNGYIVIDEGGGGSPGQWRAVFKPDQTSGSEADISATSSIAQNTWSNLVMMWSQSGSTWTISFYINGVLQGTSTWSGTPGVGGVGNFAIATGGDNLSHDFTGSIDDVRVYNGLLSTTNITALAHAGPTDAVWTAASSTTNFATPGNWDVGMVPVLGTNVEVASTPYNPILSSSESIGNLTIDASSTLDLAGHALTALSGSTFTNNGTLILHGTETLTNITNDYHGSVMYANTSSFSGLNFGNVYKNLIFNNSLQGYWKMDDAAAGSEIIDSSGYQRYGTPYGSSGANNLPQPSGSVPTNNFIDTGSYSFDGTDDYFDIAGGVPASIQGALPKTITMWVYPTQANEGFAYLGPSDGGSDGQSLRIQTDSSSKLKLDVSGSAESSGISVALNTWQFIAVQWDGSNWKVCVGAGSMSCTTLSGLSASDLQPGMFNIGRGIWDSQYMHGNIDDVRLYSEAISDAALVSLVNGDEPITGFATTTLSNTLTVNGNLMLNSGTLSAGANTIDLSGDFDTHGGSFNPGTSNFILEGGDQTIDGSNEFNTLSKITSLTPSTLTFAGGTTQYVLNQLQLHGSSGTPLYLRSSDPGTQWNVYPITTDLAYLDVEDSNNEGTTINAAGLNIVDSGNNTNWDFGIPTSVSSLVGYWKFDESATGTTAADSSGDGFGLVPTSTAPTPTTDVPTTTFSDPYSLGFNGTNNYLAATNINYLNVTSTLTIAAWVKFGSVNGTYQTIAGKWQVGVAQQYLLQLNSDNRIGFWTGNGGSTGDDLESTNTVLPGAWYHIVGTINGTSKKLYIDGSLNNSGSGTAMGASDIVFTVGSKENSSGNYFEYFNGDIDDLRLYDRVLSSTEVSELAAGNHTSATWTGAVSTDYGTAGNWDTGVVPDPFTLVIITPQTNEPIMSDTSTFAGLTIDASSTLDANFHGAIMNDNGTFTNYGTYILHGTEQELMTNDATHGSVMYVGSTTSTILKTTFGYSYNNVIINDSLLGYWPLDDASPGYAIDTSGYQRHATAYGSGDLPQPTTNVPTVNFYDTGSMNFDGTDEYFDVARGVPSEIQGSAPKTITMWVYPTRNQEGFVYMGPSDGGSTGQSLRFQTDPSGHLKIDVSGSTETSNLQVALNTWQFIAAEWDGSHWQVCLQRTCDQLNSLPTSDLQPGMFNIGRGIWDSRYMQGTIDDVRLYDQALSTLQLASMQSGDEPGTSYSTTTVYSGYFTPKNLILNSGTLDARSSDFLIGKNIVNNGGMFNEDHASVDLANTTLINSSLSLPNGGTIGSYSATTTLTIAAGSTLSVTGLWLTDSAGALAQLRSSVPGRQWNFDVSGGAPNLSYVDFQDTNNVGPTLDLAGFNAIDSGNNTNFDFGISAPIDFYGTASSTLITLRWTNPTDNFSSSSIRMSTSTYPASMTDGVNEGASLVSTSTMLTGLSDGTYYFSIFAGNTFGDISVAATTSVIIDTTPPSAPGAPTTTVALSNNPTPTISWAPAVDTGVGLNGRPYFLEYSHTSDFSSFDGAYASVSTSFTFSTSSPLADGTWYFRVYAIDNYTNVSAWSTSSAPIVVDTTGPVITLTGSSNVSIAVGSRPYVDPGATAVDAGQGDVSGEIVATGSVDASTPGTYTITYNVSDDLGNAATPVTRTVTVVAAAVDTSSHGGGGAVIVQPTAVGGSSNLAVTINGTSTGTLTTQNPTITLRFNGGSTIKGYAVSLTPDFAQASIVPYANSVSYTLPKVAGTYTLYIKFYSTTGSSSSVITRTVVYNGTNSSSVAAPSQPVHVLFKRNLKRGMTGTDVKALQQFLNAHGFAIAATGPGSVGHETTLYGAATAAAVAKFQEANADAILKPSGLTKGTGNFYAATRAVVNGL